MKVVVVGGVAAGMSAASKIKRVDKNAQVVVYEKGGHLSYGACGLAYYVGGVFGDPDQMVARTREDFAKAGIQTFLYHEVTAVDAKRKTVTVKDLMTGKTFEDAYDKLMIGTGAGAVCPDVPGREMEEIYTLKTMEDGIAVRKAAIGQDVSFTVVVGGGYIGIEAAEALARLGKKVTLLETADRILDAFDPEFSAMAEQELRSNGIEVRAGQAVTAFAGGEKVREVRTAKGGYEADIVIVTAGVRPATGFLRGSGIELAKNGAIATDRFMRASQPDVYAAGDCALVYHCVRKENVYIPLGTTANKCGRIAGANICGLEQEFPGTAGSAALKVFDLEMGKTGISKQEAQQAGLNATDVTVCSANHVSYYPGMEKITVKLVYEKPSMRILGAQVAGGDGSALRTDIFAMAVQTGMTTKELGMTDLVYAPPFADVWDAANRVANAAK